MKTKIALTVVLVLVVSGLIMAVPTSPLYAGPQRGESPRAARELASGLNVGSLNAGGEIWYHLGGRALGAGRDRLVVFNMVYRPGNHDVSPYVNFQIFSESQMERWLQGYADAVTGIGTFTTTDFDPDTSERLWAGSLFGDETYYLRLLNNAEVAIEYHLLAMSQPAEIVVVEPAVAGDVIILRPLSSAPRDTGLPPGLFRRVDISVRDRPIRLLASTLSIRSGVRIRVDRDVPQDLTVDLVARGEPLWSVLDRVAEAARLRGEVTGPNEVTLFPPSEASARIAGEPVGPSEPAPSRCPACGRSIERDWVACPGCGATLRPAPGR